MKSRSARAIFASLTTLAVACAGPAGSGGAEKGIDRATATAPHEQPHPSEKSEADSCRREESEVYQSYLDAERNLQSCVSEDDGGAGRTFVETVLSVTIEPSGGVGGSIFTQLPDADPLKRCGTKAFEGLSAAPADGAECQISFPMRWVWMERLLAARRAATESAKSDSGRAWADAATDHGAGLVNGEPVFVAKGSTSGSNVDTAANRGALELTAVMVFAAQQAGLSGFAPLGRGGEWHEIQGPTKWARVIQEIVVTGAYILDSRHDVETNTTRALVAWTVEDVKRSLSRLEGDEAAHRRANESVDEVFSLWMERQPFDLSFWSSPSQVDVRGEDGAPLWLTGEDRWTPEWLAVPGYAAGVEHPALRRITAENRARARLAKVLCRRIQTAEFSDADDPATDAGELSRGTMHVTRGTSSGLQIVDGWSDPSQRAHWSLAVLSGEDLKQARENWWDSCIESAE